MTISLLTDARLSDADPAEVRRLERLELFRERQTPWISTRVDGSRIADAVANEAFWFYRDNVIPARQNLESSGYAMPEVRAYLRAVRKWALMLEPNPLEEQ